MSRFFVLMLTTAFAAACGTEPRPAENADADVADVGPEDAGHDTTEDAEPDVAPDASDEAPDAPPLDAEPDVPPDAAADVPDDAAADVPDAAAPDVPDDAAADVPSPARCDDHITNGDELGIDCGGTCEACPERSTCAAACAARSGPTGGCDHTWTDLDVTCEAYCQDLVDDADQHTAWGVTRCLATNPLCFEDMWQCVRSAVFPEPFRSTIRVEGEGFGAHEGRVISVFATGETADDGEDPRRQAVITDGAFSVVVPSNTHVAQPFSARYWIDVDADGVCDTEADFGSLVYALSDRPLVWEGEIVNATLAERSNLNCDGF